MRLNGNGRHGQLAVIPGTLFEPAPKDPGQLDLPEDSLFSALYSQFLEKISLIHRVGNLGK